MTVDPHAVDNDSRFLDDIIVDQCQRHADKVALCCGERELSYAQLAAKINGFVVALQNRGVKQGDFVAVLLVPGLDITPALLAIVRLGAVYTPLDPEHPISQLDERCREVNPALVLSERTLESTVKGLSRPVLWVEETGDAPSTAPPPRRLEDPACIFFTSGTTGTPKGVLGSQRALREAILSPARYLGLGERDTLNAMARYAWSISMMELLMPLAVGGTSMIVTRDQALNLDQLAMVAVHCSAFHCPPALLKSLEEMDKMRKTAIEERNAWRRQYADSQAVRQ